MGVARPMLFVMARLYTYENGPYCQRRDQGAVRHKGLA